MQGFRYWNVFLLLAMVAKMNEAQRERRRDENYLGQEIVYSTSYDRLPPTANVPIYVCDSSHRPLEENVNGFQVYHNGRWWTQMCPENLEWNQVSCRCEYPDGNPANTYCRDYRHSTRGEPGKYEQYVNSVWIIRDCSLAVAGLVWDQTACQCVWGPGTSGKVTGQGITPCDIMLNITFDGGIKDETKGSFVEASLGDSIHTRPIDRDKNMAAYFQGTLLNIWFFSNNELGSSLRVEFQFKMDDVPESRDKYQILLSNGCNVTVPGYTTPSLAIGYRPGDQSYLLAFHTVSNRKAIACSLNLGAYDWHIVSLIYEDGVLFLRIDGQPCIVSQDFSGDIQTTPCPLTIGADPLERQSTYQGYMDNIVVGRYCRRYMDIQDDLDADAARSKSDTTRDRTTRHLYQQDVLSNGGRRLRKRGEPNASHREPVISSFRARIDIKGRPRFEQERLISKKTFAKTPFRPDRHKVSRKTPNRHYVRKVKDIYEDNELGKNGNLGETVENMSYAPQVGAQNNDVKNNVKVKRYSKEKVGEDDNEYYMEEDDSVKNGGEGYATNYGKKDGGLADNHDRYESREKIVKRENRNINYGGDFGENKRSVRRLSRGHDYLGIGDNDMGGRYDGYREEKLLLAIGNNNRFRIASRDDYDKGKIMLPHGNKYGGRQKGDNRPKNEYGINAFNDGNVKGNYDDDDNDDNAGVEDDDNDDGYRDGYVHSIVDDDINDDIVGDDEFDEDSDVDDDDDVDDDEDDDNDDDYRDDVRNRKQEKYLYEKYQTSNNKIIDEKMRNIVNKIRHGAHRSLNKGNEKLKKMPWWMRQERK